MTAHQMPESVYRAIHALSYSGAKLLLPPSCPARFKWDREHGRPSKPVFDFGHAAHKAVLGIGQPVRYIDAATWQTKAAKAERDEAYAAGEIPLLRKDEGVIEGMVAALRAHPIAGKLLAPGSGQAEASLFWKDPETDIHMRARLDWLPTARNDGRIVVPDYKTADSADPNTFARSAANYGYAIQDAFYSSAVESIGGDPDFVFVVQEKAEPYLVNVIELDTDAKRIGRTQKDRAARIYRQCIDTDTWPGYGDGIDLVSLPVWWQMENETEMSL